LAEFKLRRLVAASAGRTRDHVAHAALARDVAAGAAHTRAAAAAGGLLRALLLPPDAAS
jgi:hypothetical protein